jgi:hypothetical protein
LFENSDLKIVRRPKEKPQLGGFGAGASDLRD